MEVLNSARIHKTKRAFSTRRVPGTEIKILNRHPDAIEAGDLVLARVTEIGSHSRIELPTGRKATLFPGDEIVLAFGARYAPDQYEAYVPERLEPCHMVAAGGVAGKAVAWHDKIGGPTQIEPLGLLSNGDGKVINLADYALPKQLGALPQLAFAVFGTSMNAGKTTTAAAVVKAFAGAGYRVGAAKVTGTGAGNDLWLMRDYGAERALDFTDAGFVTTFRVPPDALIAATRQLLCALARDGCDVAVLEVADGLYQDETAALAASPEFRTLLSGTFFAAGDAMGAVAGAQHLAALGHHVCGISGAMTRSPLARREVSNAVDHPVYGLSELVDAASVPDWTNHRGGMNYRASA